MIPRFKPYFSWKELKAAFSIPKKDNVERFEKAFAEEMGQRYAIAFPYGRTALLFLLKALDLKDKEVICPAYTCVVVPHAIVYSGNKPVFVDSQEYDFNMDLNLAEQAITENTGAIIATSIFGYPVDLDKLDSIHKRFPHIKIIQDCAHSFSAKWKGRPIQKEGIAAIYGLNISKLITSIFGGMITTDNEELASKLYSFQQEKLKRATLRKSFKRLVYLLALYPAFWEPIYGIINRLERLGLMDRFTKYYDENAIEMPKDYLENLTKIEARIGLAQLKKYDSIIDNKIKISKRYTEMFATREDIKILPFKAGATYSHFTALVGDRNAWLEDYYKKGIQLGILIEYSIPYMQAYVKFSRGDYPVSKYFSEHTINFPNWLEITFAEKNIGSANG